LPSRQPRGRAASFWNYKFYYVYGFALLVPRHPPAARARIIPGRFKSVLPNSYDAIVGHQFPFPLCEGKFP